MYRLRLGKLYGHELGYGTMVKSKFAGWICDLCGWSSSVSDCWEHGQKKIPYVRYGWKKMGFKAVQQKDGNWKMFNL